MTFSQKMFALVALSFFGTSAIIAALPKNDFRDQITALVDEFHGGPTQETELHDKFFTEIFREAIPADAAIVRLNDGNSKELCDFIKETSAEMGIPTPRLYLSTDDVRVDAKFATHNNTYGILLHSKLFSTFNTLNLKHYLRNSVLKRLQAVHQKHLAAVEQRENKYVANGLGFAAATALLLALTQYDQEKFGIKFGSKNTKLVLSIVAALVAAGGATRLMNLMKRTLSTHAYEQVSSHENTEYGREDVFPGPAEGLVDAHYDAAPEHLLAMMLRIKKRIAEENKKYAELRRLEIEEEEEMARKMGE